MWGERMKVKVGGKQGSQEERMQSLGDESMVGSRNREQFGVTAAESARCRWES